METEEKGIFHKAQIELADGDLKLTLPDRRVFNFPIAICMPEEHANVLPPELDIGICADRADTDKLQARGRSDWCHVVDVLSSSGNKAKERQAGGKETAAKGPFEFKAKRARDVKDLAELNIGGDLIVTTPKPICIPKTFTDLIPIHLDVSVCSETEKVTVTVTDLLLECILKLSSDLIPVELPVPVSPETENQLQVRGRPHWCNIVDVLTSTRSEASECSEKREIENVMSAWEEHAVGVAEMPVQYEEPNFNGTMPMPTPIFSPPTGQLSVTGNTIAGDHGTHGMSTDHVAFWVPMVCVMAAITLGGLAVCLLSRKRKLRKAKKSNLESARSDRLAKVVGNNGEGPSSWTTPRPLDLSNPTNPFSDSFAAARLEFGRITRQSSANNVCCTDAEGTEMDEKEDDGLGGRWKKAATMV